MTWSQLIRRLKVAGFAEHRTGKGSHRQFVNPTTRKVITVSVHTKKDVRHESRAAHRERGRAMTQYFPVVIERESNGTFSAWVAGLPGVYAAADTAAVAKRAIRGALAAHLEALQALGRDPQPQANLSVLRRDVYATRPNSLRFVGVGALLGRSTSHAKAQASRRNGRKGGRPRVIAKGS